MKEYVAKKDCDILGSFRKAGDNVGMLTQRQAKYHELQGVIAEVIKTPAPLAKPDKSKPATPPAPTSE